MRMIKSDSEIAQMKFASDVSSLAHIAAMKHGGGSSAKENQLQSLIEGFFLDMQVPRDGLILLLLGAVKMQPYCITSKMKIIAKMVMLY